MTFTSDKERREVAARMREIMRKNPHMWLDVMVANAVCDVMGEGRGNRRDRRRPNRPPDDKRRCQRAWPRLLPQLRLRRLVPCPGRKCPLLPKLRRGGNR